MKYSYDALHRRIHKAFPGGSNWLVYDYYYNTSWQVLEVRGGLVATAPAVGETVGHQYVWDARCVHRVADTAL